MVVTAPLFATVWGMPAMRELLNDWDNSFVRFDYCMDGRAYNREMAVWTTLPMEDFARYVHTLIHTQKDYRRGKCDARHPRRLRWSMRCWKQQ